MTNYRKKSVVVKAEQWHEVKGTWAEGYHLTVGYYRTPDLDGQTLCKHCGRIMHDHGWMDTLEDGHIVCPNDWIIQGIKGEFYPIKNDIFLATYEKSEITLTDGAEWAMKSGSIVASFTGKD